LKATTASVRANRNPLHAIAWPERGANVLGLVVEHAQVIAISLHSVARVSPAALSFGFFPQSMGPPETMVVHKYVVELIGMFFFVLVVGMTVVGHTANDGVIPPLAIGATLMVLVFAGGHISGGHFNPAVTLGVWLRGRCDTKDVIPYWIAQIIGAVAAAFVVMYLKDASGTAGDPDVPRWLIAEFLGTFLLVFVVLNVATAKGTANNSFYGLAIGFTVVVMAFALGGISGGAFNPAIAIGATVMGLIKGTAVWIHLVADFAGGAAAAFAFKALNPNDP
jgi:aquaporin Z